MKRKTLLSLSAALMLSLGISGAAAAEALTPVSETVIEITASEESEALYAVTGQWKQNTKGWWYSFSNGTYAKGGLYNIGGKTYYFNASGYMVTGWLKYGYDWLYFTSSGAMCTPGWQAIKGKWYHFSTYDRSGVGTFTALTRETMTNGRVQIGGKYYYFDETGALYTGWKSFANSYWRYYTDKGEASGWMKINNKWYYFDEYDHCMLSGTLFVDPATGFNYRFRSSGEMAVGWYKDYDGTYYYHDANGHEASGFRKVGDKIYYLNPGLNNQMVSDGTYYIDDHYYAFDSTGAALTNTWYNPWGDDFFIYYFGETGAHHIGWLKLDNKWYYCDPVDFGVRTSGLRYIDGFNYYFDDNGVMQTGWVNTRDNDKDTWYYFDANGKGHNGTLQLNGKTYTFSNGYML